MAERGKIKSTLFFVCKIALAATVVWILFSRGQQEILKCFRSFDYRYLIPAFFVQFFQHLFSARRWQILAEILKIRLGFAEALSLTMQGNFFSLVIPGGAIGGDVIKMAVISRRSRSGSRMEGAFTVLMDRIVGMISLFTLTLLLLIPGSRRLLGIHFGELPCDTSFNMLLIGGLVLLCLAGLGASCVIFFHRTLYRIPGIGFLLKKADSLTKGTVSRMTGAADIYRKHWKTLGVLTFFTTFFVHLWCVIPFYLLLKGLGVEFSLFALILAVNIGNIAGLIPLFPGGIGIRDLVTVTILSANAVAPGDAKTAQLLATALMLAMNLAGGIFFIFDPGRCKQEGKNEQQ
jgi:uncharacterized protein (TIRG00374 family)